MTGAAQHRKRGGQPGNTNSLKHGFYSQSFKPTEDADLETLLLDGLQNEVAMLRVMIRRVVVLASRKEAAASFAKAITTLNTLGAASTRLSGLLRMERMMSGNNSKVANVLCKAIDDALAEFRGGR